MLETNPPNCAPNAGSCAASSNTLRLTGKSSLGGGQETHKRKTASANSSAKATPASAPTTQAKSLSSQGVPERLSNSTPKTGLAGDERSQPPAPSCPSGRAWRQRRGAYGWQGLPAPTRMRARQLAKRPRATQPLQRHARDKPLASNSGSLPPTVEVWRVSTF